MNSRLTSPPKNAEKEHKKFEERNKYAAYGRNCDEYGFATVHYITL
jgi:hypothetical protein